MPFLIMSAMFGFVSPHLTANERQPRRVATRDTLATKHRPQPESGEHNENADNHRSHHRVEKVVPLEDRNGNGAEKVPFVEVDCDREKLHGKCDLDIVEEKIVHGAQQALHAGNLQMAEKETHDIGRMRGMKQHDE